MKQLQNNAIRSFREEHDYLSNFYPAPVEYKGLWYLNNEAAFQAQKCMTEEEKQAFTQLEPSKAKRLGRQVPLRPDWEEVKVEIMAEIVRAKFTQNPRLARLLVETGDIPLLEGNRWGDTFWGINRKTGQGENHLGKILMALRQRFRTEGIPEGQEYHPVRKFGPVNGITVTDEDITMLEVDCIVNAANKTLLGGGGWTV